jgi:hypothetical protein
MMERRGERTIPCPNNNDGCKYAPNCHLSEHHIYPRRTAENPLMRRFGNLAINKIVSCRMIHDLLDTFPPPKYPSEAEMQKTIEREQK